MVLAVDKEWEEKRFAMLWLTAYVFLMRLPSEASTHPPFHACFFHDCFHQALPLCTGTAETQAASLDQTVIWRERDEVCLRIRKRKNRRSGSGVLRRACTCSGNTLLCPVHMIWDTYLAFLPLGSHPWDGITDHLALRRLRSLLEKLGVENAKEYCTKDFRRGHAEADAGCACLLCEVSVLLAFAGHEKIWMFFGSHPGGRAMEVQCIHEVPGRIHARKGSGLSDCH